VGKLGEKTAEGRPKPDERTVAYLVDLCLFETEAEVVQVLSIASVSSVTRYPFETAKPVADWLEATLGPTPVKKGLSPSARVVRSNPSLLTRDAAMLQLKWDALMLSAEQGGVGCMLSEEQAREAVLKHPQILTYAQDNLRCGWSMLTAKEGGLGLPHKEARESILVNPRVLQFDFDKFTKRVELLRSLGFEDAHRMVLSFSAVLVYTDKTVIEHEAWWRQSGLNHVKLITSLPTLLGACSTSELQAKLDFLRNVAGLSVDDVNSGAPFFSASLDDKLRPRFFYARRHGALERYKLSSLIFCTVEVFLQRVHLLDAPASEADVRRYKETAGSDCA